MRRRTAWAAVLIALAGCAGRAPTPAPTPTAVGPSPMMMPTPMVSPGLLCPPAQPAGDAELPDDAEVVGVVAGGTARAYLLAAMDPETSRVINDLVGDAPVTVAYYPPTKCVRTFTEDVRGAVLDISKGGYWDGLLLHAAGQGFYRQSSLAPMNPAAPPFPYPQLPHEVTIWKAWREAHPGTDVFTGK
jgi:hypothetical protein